MSDLLDGIYDVLSDFAVWLIDVVLNAAMTLLEAIPAPDFFANVATYAGQIPSDVLFWVDPLEIPTGLSIIMSAYILRFIIKRIPFIGG